VLKFKSEKHTNVTSSFALGSSSNLLINLVEYSLN